MILLTDSDGNPVLVNPEYLVGAHQSKTDTVITMVGEDVTYRVTETPEDIHDAWTGVEGIEIEYGEETEDCSTCDYAEDGEAVPGQLICQMCVDYDLWEPADEDGQSGDGEDTGGSAEEAGGEPAKARVSGVPYAVPITCKGPGGVHD